MCFDDKRVKSPAEIVCMTCSFNYWAGLQKAEVEKQVIQGAAGECEDDRSLFPQGH